MKMGGQLHALAALLPGDNRPYVPNRRLFGFQKRSGSSEKLKNAPSASNRDLACYARSPVTVVD